ncbi:MAG: diguanylate cyclase, partial [Actinomycetales bacterium]|nr:diguanylate cyclase [Actinomycetales bacterium]
YSLGKRVLNAVNSTFVSDSGLQLPVATSIGVAMWNSEGTFEDSMRTADALMYQAKQAGGSLAVEDLAGTASSDATAHLGTAAADLQLISTTVQVIERTHDSERIGLLISVESPLRSIGAQQLAGAVDLAVSKSAVPNPERILLRFSNHFWNHAQLIPAVLDLLIVAHEDVVFAAVIDAALIGTEPSEVLLRLARDERIGLVLDGQGGAASKFSLLDVLHPIGLTVPAEKLTSLVANRQPSKSLRAMAAVTAALNMDFYCLDWEEAAVNALLAQAGIGFVSFKVLSLENKG